MPANLNSQRSYGWQSRRLKKGDLVFFDENGGGGLTHVGIYAGNNDIVHASNYYMAVVESDKRYIPGFAGWRRIR
jgi:cell wall-associated NlpC family hydrolase